MTTNLDGERPSGVRLLGGDGAVAAPPIRRGLGRLPWLGAASLQSAVVVLAGVIVLGLFSRQYVGSVFILALTYGIVTVGMAIQIGYSQQVAFSQGVFMGFGAYCVALLNVKVGLPSLLALVIATAGGCLASYLVGGIVSQARGLAMPVATIMFPLIATGVVNGSNYLGASIGLPLTGNLWPGSSGTSATIGNGAVIVAIVAVIVLGSARMLKSQVGLELFILGVDERTAAAMGVATGRRKLELFVIGSTLATLGGAAYAGSQLFVPATLVTASAQLSLLMMLFIGGRRSVLGAIVGAVTIEYVAGISNFVSIHLLIIEGVLITVILLIEPEGLAGIGLKVASRLGWVPGSRAARAGTAPAAPVTRGWPDVPGGGRPDVPVAPVIRGRPDGPGHAGGLLVCERISKDFGGLRVLEDVSFSLPASGVFGLCGPNGAGKTTLLSIVGGAMPPSGGRVLLEGEDVTRLIASQRFDRGVARTFQAVHLVPGRTALENVAVACLSSNHHGLLRGVADRGMSRALEQAEAALDLLGISELRDRDVSSLTLEGQRMVELARAMAPGPRLLLLDEPASGLSESQRDALKDTLRSVSQATCVLLVEHDLHLVADVAERIFVLATGRLVFDGDGQEFFASELVQSLLIGSQPVANPVVANQEREGGSLP